MKTNNKNIDSISEERYQEYAYVGQQVCENADRGRNVEVKKRSGGGYDIFTVDKHKIVIN